MIKTFFTMILILFINTENSHATYSLTTSWNSLTEKKVILWCDDYSTRTCLAVCKSTSRCIINEGICYNCIGNNLFIVNFYKNLGLTVNSTSVKIHNSEIEKVLLNGSFITLKAKSVYNLISDHDSKSMRRKFQNLCPEDIITEPVVFARVDRNRIPVELLFVVCGSEAYEMITSNSFYHSSSTLY